MILKYLSRFFIAFITFCCTINLFAQDEKTFNLIPTKAVKVSPFELFTSTPSIPIGYEFRIGERLNLCLETGLVFNLFDAGVTSEFPFWGAKNRVELRLYLDKERKSPTYIAWDVMHKFYYQNRTQWVCRQDCAYEEQISYQRFHSALAGHVKWGILSFFSEKTYLDTQFGVGARWRYRAHNDFPIDATTEVFDDRDSFLEIPPGSVVIPSLMFRMLLGFGL